MEMTSRAQDIRGMLIIVMVALSGLMGIDLHLASMPYIMKYMHTDMQHVQQSVSFYLLGLGLSLLLYGPLSDKYGRKPVVLFGLIFASLTSFAAVLTSNITVFLWLRLLQGLGAGACAGLGRPMVVDMFHKKSLESMRSYFSAVVGLSPILAPVLGSYLQHYFNWQANFIFLGLFFFMLIFLFGFLAPETNRHIQPNLNLFSTLIPNYHYLVKHRAFLGATLLGGIGMAANMIYAVLSPFIFQVQYHVSVIAYGWITGIVSVGIILGRIFNGYMIRKFGNLGTLEWGMALVLWPAIGMLLLSLTRASGLTLLLIGIFLILSGQAFMRSNSMFIALLPHDDKRGSAGALFGSFQTLIAFVSSTIAGLFSSQGLVLLSVIYVVLGLSAYLVYFFLVKKTESLAKVEMAR